MTRYDTYKDSGVQWLGKIPGHWEETTLRKFLKMVSIKNHPEKPLLSVTREDGVIVRNKESKEANHNFIPEDLSGYKYVEVGDFCINKMKSWQGSYGVSNYEGIVSPAYYICKLMGVYKPFFNTAIRSKIYIPFFTQYSKGIRVDQWDLSPLGLKAIPFFLPPLSEQRSIVSYLDDKCGKIVKLLEGKQKQIDLLTETKQRIIADAVTRGLNPTVKMKPTNISWLPEIPEHWELVKMKAFCKDNKEKNKGNYETCVLSLSYGNVIVKQNINFGLVPDNYESYQVVYPGYIILRLTDLQNDHKSLRTGLVKNKGIITSAYVGLIVQNMDSQFAQLLLHSYDIMKVFYGMGGGLRQSMSYQDIANLYIPVPPLSEQRSIVSYIESRISKIDLLADKLHQEIEAIKEYKKRLISDVVTGQIKVY